MSTFEQIILQAEPYSVVILQGVQIFAAVALVLLLFNIRAQRRLLNEMRKEITLSRLLSSFFGAKGFPSTRRLTLDDLAQTICDAVVHTTGIPFALFVRIFPEAEVVRLSAFSPEPLITSVLSGLPEKNSLMSESQPFLPQSGGFQIARKGFFVFNTDVLDIFAEGSSLRKFLEELMLKAHARGLCFSLLYVDQAPFAGLVLGSLRPQFSENFLFLLEKIRHFSQFLLETMLFCERKEEVVNALKSRENLLKLLNDISRAINLQMDTTSIIQYALARMEEEIPSLSAMIFTLSPEKTHYKLTGITQSLTRKEPAGILKVGTTFPEKNFPHIHEWTGPFLTSPPAVVPSEFSHLKPLCLFPIQTTEGFYGILAVVNSTHLSEPHREFCAGLTEHLAVAFQNVHRKESLKEELSLRKKAEEEARKQVSYLTFLRNIDTAILGITELKVLHQFILSELVRQANVDASRILLLVSDGDRLECVSAEGFRSEEVARIPREAEKGFFRIFLEAKKSVMISDYTRESEETRELRLARIMREEGFHSYMGIPLISKGKILGVQEFFWRHPQQFTPEQVQFLETIARETAIATENLSTLEHLQKSQGDLIVAYDTTLEGWATLLDLREKETAGHSQRVAIMSLRLAKLVGVSEKDYAHIRRGALLHDIGKIIVPDHILLKTGPLNEEEWKIMKMHPVVAYELLNKVPFLQPALDIPYAHHEKWDGKGYPRGLQGYEIPLHARFFALIDVYDALTSERPYRKAYSPSEALSIMEREVEKHFDPDIFKIFLKNFADITNLVNKKE
ncbi:MAG: HD domain-containing phosphohydrolase [bacterium JZ-2024 1]